MTQRYDTPLELDARDAALTVFRRQRQFAEHCLDQTSDAHFFLRPAPHMNSIAVLVQHLAGNMMSRWGDFDAMLRGESDGEKPTRDRDGEFAAPPPTAEGRAALMQAWDAGWRTLEAALEPLTVADFERVVRIRGVPHSVHLAIARQIDHYGAHIGQIAFLARLQAEPETWRYFTIPPGRSAAFNEAMRTPHSAE